MTIHHDKMAYGKLDPLREEFSLERLNDMADALNGEGEGRSEREKMLAGELYDPSDPELSALRARARRASSVPRFMPCSSSASATFSSTVNSSCRLYS